MFLNRKELIIIEVSGHKRWFERVEMTKPFRKLSKSSRKKVH